MEALIYALYALYFMEKSPWTLYANTLPLYINTFFRRNKSICLCDEL